MEVAMFVTISLEEIKKFPPEIRDFLTKYLQSSLNSALTPQNSSSVNQIPKPDFSRQLKVSDGLNGVITRHMRVNLIEANFGWEQMIADQIEGLDGDLYNDFHINVTDNNYRFSWNSTGGSLDHKDPKTWGIAVIFLSLFGFGGTLPGYKPAKNPKELGKNLEKIGISDGAPVQVRSIGPLLRPITKLVQIWHSKYLDGPPLNQVHWYDFDKAGNFYFAGNTAQDCYEAAKKISEQYLIVK